MAKLNCKSNTLPQIIPFGPVAGSRATRMADELIDGMLGLLDRPSISIQYPIDWELDPYEDRSWRYQLHSWDPQMALCAVHYRTACQRHFDLAKGLCETWLQSHWDPDREVYGGEWGDYDMAVGKRAAVLAYVAACLERDGTRLRDGGLIDEGAQRHLDWLYNPKNLNSHGNHGLFQLGGLLALSRQAPWLNSAEQSASYAIAELVRIYQQHYTPDGVHREHSPEYHQMTLLLASTLLDCGLVPKDSPLLTVIERGIAQLVWMVHPDGKLAGFGDSKGSGCQIKAVLANQSETLMWHRSRGKKGIPPPELSHISSDGGLVTVRSDLEEHGPTRWSCVIIQAAYHGDRPQHKHADDGTFEWSYCGTRIIIDAGKYAYDYDSPNRQYCSSARAHNTIALDDLPLRIKGPSKLPSAKIGAVTIGDGRMVAAALMQRPLDERELGPLVQDRLLVGRVDRGLVILDEVSVPDATELATQWFHFHPSLKFSSQGRGMIAKHGKRTIAAIPLSPWKSRMLRCRGQEEPWMQGWHSPETNSLIPNDALGNRGCVEDRWYSTALLIADRGTPSMRIHRVGESIELSQIDATGEQLLASITGGVESGHRIFEGDRVGLAIARGRGSWCCDLAIDLDDSAMALTRISRVLRLGLVTMRLAKRHLQIATKKERVVLALVDGRINVRLIWTETTGLQVWAGGTCQGHLAHTGFVPSTAYIGEPTSDRSWSGLLRHFSIRQGENHEEWDPDDVVAAPDDLALITGLWNEELMDQLKNDVLAQTGLLRH